MQSHETVLLHGAVDALDIAPNGTVVDATLGSGGHAREICTRLNSDGTLIALDADPDAIAAATDLTGPHVHLLHCNFRDIDKALQPLGDVAPNAILADLGWRMEQMQGNGKGFSFLRDEPLVMTYGDPGDYPFVARDIVNTWAEGDIKNVLKGYGEERFSGRIARTIVESREDAQITSSLQLAEIVKKAVPGFYRRGKIHPATRTFQALRIAVNDELEALKEFIHKSVSLLEPSGRLVIITFHSTEDRIVKQLFRECAANELGIVCTKKPIVASREEILRNSRARSAKMRVFQKYGNT